MTHADTKTTGRSDFGSVCDRPGRPGFYVQFHHDGRRIQRFGSLNYKTAEKRLRTVRALLDEGVPFARVLADVFGDFNHERMTFRAAVVKYLAHAKTTKRATTYASDALNLRAMAGLPTKEPADAAEAERRLSEPLRAGAAPWATKYLGKITPGDVAVWAEGRRKSRIVGGVSRRAVSEATINRNLCLLSALFRWAKQAPRHYVEGNPVREVEREEVEEAETTYLTAAESRALLDACSPVLRPIVLCALHTGMRRGEMLSLRWQNVDLAAGTIFVSPKVSKSKKGRTIPATADLLADLKRLRGSRKKPATDDSDRVFTDNEGDGVQKGAVRSMFAAAVQRCGPREGEPEGCSGVPIQKRAVLRFHDLRHTAASLMVGAGVPLFDVAKILGHSTLACTMRYAHFAPEAGRSAIDRLGSALASAPPVQAQASA